MGLSVSAGRGRRGALGEEGCVMHTNTNPTPRSPLNPAFPSSLHPRHVNSIICRIYCHKVVKLSDAVQALPRQETMFVHGVSPNFLEVGFRSIGSCCIHALSAAARHASHAAHT